MISYIQAIILGALQGITELFPISSLGHGIIVPVLLGWKLNQSASSFLIFLVATHFATAIVLFLFFWQDWKRIIVETLKSIKNKSIANVYAKLGWLLIVGTIPAGLVGLLFEKKLENLFLAPLYVSAFLILNGIMLFGAELLRKKAKKAANPSDSVDQRIATNVSFGQSVKIGLAQVLALIPGFSRTGSTLAGGLLVGLSHEDALRFSFLLATPIIGAAAVLELPKLLLAGNMQNINVAIAGAVAAAIAAYVSVKFLTKYFKTNNLNPFAIYCVVAGVLSVIILLK